MAGLMTAPGARRRALVGVAAVAAALALAAGCAGDREDEAAPVAPELPSVPIAAPGEVVRAGPDTPAAVQRALAGSRVIVVAFLLRGVADDDSVGASLREVRRTGAARRGVVFFTYTIGRNGDFGDLAEVLAIEETPAVAVIGRNRRLINLWEGLVDADIIRQSIADARDTPPLRRGAPAPTLPARGEVTD